MVCECMGDFQGHELLGQKTLWDHPHRSREWMTCGPHWLLQWFLPVMGCPMGPWYWCLGLVESCVVLILVPWVVLILVASPWLCGPTWVSAKPSLLLWFKPSILQPVQWSLFLFTLPAHGFSFQGLSMSPPDQAHLLLDFSHGPCMWKELEESEESDLQPSISPLAQPLVTFPSGHHSSNYSGFPPLPPIHSRPIFL